MMVARAVGMVVTPRVVVRMHGATVRMGPMAIRMHVPESVVMADVAAMPVPVVQAVVRVPMVRGAPVVGVPILAHGRRVLAAAPLRPEVMGGRRRIADRAARSGGGRGRGHIGDRRAHV